MNALSTILKVSKLVLHTGEVLFTYIQCSEPSSSPNVLPEGLEQTIRMIDVLMPWGITWLTEAPILGKNPRVGQAQAAEAVGWIGLRVHPLHPNSASQVQP